MKSMFQQKSKKKQPPPRPPPPNFMKYRSKSYYNLNQNNVNLIDWSPPSSPKPEHSHVRGSVSSSYSSSTSSLTSSKRSFDNDLFNVNASTLNWVSSVQTVQSKENAGLRPRIIRPAPPKKVLNRNNIGGGDSPPMPNVPAPSLPQGRYDVITPYGVALYDFPATQPGDLALQVNDVVELIKRVDSEWLYGKIYDREGIFPASFLQIEVPLPGISNYVTALYEFKPQMPGDLELKPGQKIKILKEVSSDWLLGEIEGRTGQFPRNFVS